MAPVSSARLVGATLACATATVLLALPAPAVAGDAGDRVTLRGPGCSGRAGLPLDAAVEGARRGLDARAILGQVTGTVGAAPDRPVVATLTEGDVSTLDARLVGPGHAYLGPSSVELPAGAALHLVGAGDALEVTTVDVAGEAVRSRTEDLLLAPAPGGHLASGGHDYAGSWRVTSRSGALTVRDELSIDGALELLRPPVQVLGRRAAMDALVIASRSAALASPDPSTVQVAAGPAPRELLAAIAHTRQQVLLDDRGQPGAVTVCRTSTGWRRELTVAGVARTLGYRGTPSTVALDGPTVALDGDAGRLAVAADRAMSLLHLPGPVAAVVVQPLGGARSAAHLTAERADPAPVGLPVADLPLTLPAPAVSAQAPQLAPQEPGPSAAGPSSSGPPSADTPSNGPSSVDPPAPVLAAGPLLLLHLDSGARQAAAPPGPGAGRQAWGWPALAVGALLLVGIPLRGRRRPRPAAVSPAARA